MKAKPKPVDGKELLDNVKQKVKNNQKENKEMNNTLKTIITVAVTLVIVAALAALAMFAYQKGASDEKAKYESIKSEAKSLSVVTDSKK